MIHPSLGTFAMATLILALGCSVETPSSTMPGSPPPPSGGDQASTKAQVQKALEVGKDNPNQAISILEGALKSAPDDREALLLLSVISVVQGESSQKNGDRITLFHKSYAALGRLKTAQKELNPAEKSFVPRIELGEARALALEGKTAESFALVKVLMTTGNGDFDSIETVGDLQPVQALPEFKTFLDSVYKPKLDEAKKQVADELAADRSFAFDFHLKDLENKKVSLADYRGKVTIVDLWGTWCPPCRKEIPHFVALSKKYKDQGLEIVGINCNEEGTDAEIKKTIGDFARAYQIEYKCVLNDDNDRIESRIPGFQGYPTTLFIDRSGKVRLVFSQAEPKAKIEAAIATLLAETPKAP